MSTKLDVETRVARLAATGELGPQFEDPELGPDLDTLEGVGQAVEALERNVERLITEEVAQLGQEVADLKGDVRRLQVCVRRLIEAGKQERA